MDLIGWLVAPIGTAMLIERGDAVGAWLVNRSADSLPEDARESFREEWLADLARVDGKAWKLWFGFGVFVRCLPSILRSKHAPKSNTLIATGTNSQILRRLRRSFSAEAWNSLLNAAMYEADQYTWNDPAYRIEFMEEYVFKHGKLIDKEYRAIMRIRRKNTKALFRMHRRRRRRR